MKKKLYSVAALLLCIVMACTLNFPAAATDTDGYVLLKSDTFEGDACTIATSNLLSNPQSYLWDNISTVSGTDSRAIDGNGLLFDFQDMTDDSNRWVTPLRIDASKAEIRNGFYTIQMQFRDAGVRTYHIQLKTLDGDSLVGEYYFDADTLKTLDTGNGKPVIGSSTRENGITEVVLDFGTVSQVYVDITIQVDVNAAKRYCVLDNIELSGLQIEDYPQFTYRAYQQEFYTQSTGIWEADENAQVLEIRNETLYVQGNGTNTAVLKSKAVTLDEGYYKIHFRCKPNEVNGLKFSIYSAGVLLYECSYDIKSNSTDITKYPIELFIDKDRATGYYTLSVCFQNKNSGDVQFAISLEGSSQTPEISVKRFDILKSFENQSVLEDKPAGSVIYGETAGQYAAVSSIKGSTSSTYIWIIVAGMAAVTVVVAAVIIVRKRGKKNEN